MKQELTKEEVQFIDNYLKNSGVEFIDVRVEMIDHVASEIENRLEENSTSSFYDEFKLYMIQHKKALLKNIEKYRWDLDKKALKVIGNNMFNPLILVVFLIGCGVLYTTGFSINNIEILWTPTLILSSIYILPLLIYRDLKISFIHHLVVLVHWINFIVFRIWFYLDLDNGLLFNSILLITFWFNLSVVKTLFESFHYYKAKFKKA